MIKLELFYYGVLSAIRTEQTEYLKGQKRQPFVQDLPEVEYASAEAYAQMTKSQKFVYRRHLRKQLARYRKALKAQKQPVDERLTRGYNAGIEFALRILEREFTAFYKRVKREEV